MGALPRPCIAKEKSANAERYASVSRARHSVRTSSPARTPPKAPGTQARSQPFSACARTQARQLASTLRSSSSTSARSTQRSSATAKARCSSSKNGHSSLPRSLPCRVNRFVERQRPLVLEHTFGHRVRESRPARDGARDLSRARQQSFGHAKFVVKAPLECLRPGHRASRVEQLARSSEPDDARQHRARAHVAAGQTNADEQKRNARAFGPEAQVAGHRENGAGTGTCPIHRGHDWLRTRPHRFDQVAGHLRELEESLRISLGQRPDDLTDVASGAKISTG